MSWTWQKHRQSIVTSITLYSSARDALDAWSSRERRTRSELVREMMRVYGKIKNYPESVDD
jgi:hypothetical protein